jgi:DNA-binding CsgD family transcriptional regulator
MLSTEELLSKTLERLTVISKVMALSLVRSVSSREEQVELLSVAGYSIREIADLLGISYNTVGVIQFSLRKRDNKKRAKLSKSSGK